MVCIFPFVLTVFYTIVLVTCKRSLSYFIGMVILCTRLGYAFRFRMGNDEMYNLVPFPSYFFITFFYFPFPLHLNNVENVKDW